MQYSLEIPYQPTVERLLKAALEKERIPSAYLFAGSEGTGKWDAAIRFAAELLASTQPADVEREVSRKKARKLIHPDLHMLFPMPSPKNKTEEAELPEHFRKSKAADPFAPVEYGRAANILLDNVRSVKRSLYSTSAEGGWKVAIFNQVERMPETSFDILLKTIEEPPPMTVLLLLADNVRRLPRTVISRCQRVRFRPMPIEFVAEYLVDAKGMSPGAAARFARLSNGSITEAHRLANSDLSERREGALRALKAMAEDEKPKVAEAVEYGLNSGNRDDAIGAVKIWQSMIRDIAVINCGLSTDAAVVNSDAIEELRRISPRFKDMRTVTRAMAELLETQKLFYRNVPPRLALTRCSWRISDIVRKRKRVAPSRTG